MKISPIIERLKHWRATNGLSQMQTILVMRSHGDLDVRLSSIQKYEIGERQPSRFVTRALEQFLDAHPVITDAPVLGRWKDYIPDAKVTEVRSMRAGGASLASIAAKYGISESSVSRICNRNRRALAP